MRLWTIPDFSRIKGLLPYRKLPILSMLNLLAQDAGDGTRKRYQIT